MGFSNITQKHLNMVMKNPIIVSGKHSIQGHHMKFFNINVALRS